MVRVVEVPVGATLEALGEALSACFWWSLDEVAMFTVRAVRYSACSLVESLPSREVTVDSLGLRVGERFTWALDVTMGWLVDVRVEAVTAVDDGRVRCVSGRRAGPPVWCRCPAEFFAWEDEHTLVEFIDCLSVVLDTDDAGSALIGERLAGIAAWVLRDRFDQDRVNTALDTLEVRSCVSSSRSA